MTLIAPQAHNINTALARSARKHASRIAVRFLHRSWTYRQLNAAVDRVAAYLLQQGLQQGDRLVAYGKNSDAYLITWLACLRAGLVHVPTNFALCAEELRYVLQQSDAQGLISDISLSDTVKSACKDLSLTLQAHFHGSDPHDSDILKQAQSEHSATAPAINILDDELAQLLYTSGTTAAPKAAMMTHKALLAEYYACMVELDLRPDDAVLAALPLYHSAQMHVFLMPSLLLGASIRLMESPVPDLCLQWIEEEGLTSFFAPPTFWIALLRHPDFDRRNLSSLNKAYYGASIMPVPVLNELQERLPSVGLYNCYGQSEIAPLATVLRPEEHATRPASAGRPILTVETRIVDLEMQDLPAGQQGEIVHRSPQLLTGYWRKPEMTEEAFQGGWFHSGDVGYMDEEGYLYIVDRIKDVINTGGVVVASREVEEALFTHPAVSEVAVIGLPDEKWIEAIVAVVVMKDGMQIDEDELIQHARRHLAPYKLPKRVVFSHDLPKSTAGKILKRHLRQELQI